MADVCPIGIFDSGFGGLTVFRSIKERLPQYDYLYLGDNARAPYGNRALDVVYKYTLECVEWMFEQGCPLIILACNTASAKALRQMQQEYLPRMQAEKRVLGVIRPTSEIIGEYTQTGKVGILATKGTVSSAAYPDDIHLHYPNIKVYQHACPLWVPMIEHGEHKTERIDDYIKEDVEKLLKQSPEIDTVLLGCTHYPLVAEKVRAYLPDHVTLLSQGDIVAESLEDYLKRNTFIEQQISRNETMRFYTTDATEIFNEHATEFFGQEVSSEQVVIK